jgi:hypothetical protein
MRLESLFPLGNLYATPGVIAAAEASGDNLMLFVFRHSAGDWGDLSREDVRANAQSLKDSTRLLSAYHLKDGTKIWVITEADRSSSTILLPGEY